MVLALDTIMWSTVFKVCFQLHVASLLQGFDYELSVRVWREGLRVGQGLTLVLFSPQQEPFVSPKLPNEFHKRWSRKAE
jgi:hypothetical protein